MSLQTIRMLIAGALFVHGIGHTLGIWKPQRTLPLLHVSEGKLKLVAGMLWILIALGFIASAASFYGIFLPAAWWRSLALAFAIVSFACLFLFGRKWPVFNYIGASAMNIVILVALLWFHWPPFNLFAR